MGIYGSPDLSRPDPKPEKKQKKNDFEFGKYWFLILVYLFMMGMLILNAEDKFEIIISIIGLTAISVFVVTFIKMLFDLITKKRVNQDVVIIIISIIVIGICLTVY
jgi:uncharacterized membrane protein